tara:strand:+ start:401 stop:1546 length:1146 start_codon:yes stop_codon:yes gene_type:complete
MEGLEQKFADMLNANANTLKAQMSELETAQKEGAKIEDLKNLESAIEESKTSRVKMQEQLDNISIDLKNQNALIKNNDAKEDSIASIVKSNFSEISKVYDNKKAFTLEVKDMTLGSNLTGDQPRDYNNNTVIRPPQMTNAEDLMRILPISGGTYTFNRLSLSTNNIATQTEGALKGQNEYSYDMVDANTDFIAGFSVYSRKMRNNLPFLEASLSTALREDYYRAENAEFETILAAQATASTEVITSSNKIQMLIGDIAALADNNFMANGVVVRPSDYYDILITEKSTGAGYGLPGVVTFEGGLLRINGIPVYLATWLPADKYYVGDWSRVSKIVTEGFSFTVSEDDSDNFRKNNITAKVECQCTCVIEQPDAVIYGDFSAT